MSRSTVWTIARVSLTLACFVLGMYGFHLAALAQPGNAGDSLLDNAWAALNLMKGEMPADVGHSPLPWPLQFARIGLPLAAAWTAIGLGWLKIRSPVRAAVIRLRGGHAVVAGDDSLAGAVVLTERREKRGVIVWSDAPSAAWVQAAADQGAASVAMSGPDRGARKLGLDKARAVLLAGPSDTDNVALAGAVLDQAIKSRDTKAPLAVIARVDDPDLRAAFELKYDQPGVRSAARLRLASLPAAIARQIFLTLPPDRFQRGDSNAMRLMFIGFGAVSQRFALRTLAGLHVSDRRLELMVLSPAADQRGEAFFARHPGAKNLAPVVFTSAAVDQPALAARIVSSLVLEGSDPVAVVVDLDDTKRNLSVALAIERAWASPEQIAPPIYVVSDDALDRALLGDGLIAIGVRARAADPELLLQERLDALARSIHDFYFEGQLEAGQTVGSRISMQEWDLLPEAVRDDNRLLADCYELKLRSLGIGVAAALPDDGPGAALERDEVESLSRGEHDRWMAAKLLDGWVHAENRDDTLKLHPDIVPYDQLDESRKDLDREQIRVVTRLLKSSGRRAVRDLVLVVADGCAGAARAWSSAAEKLKASYPDRRLVTLGRFEDSASRAALIEASAAGLPIAVVLTANSGATLSALGPPERQAAGDLLRASQRIYALPAKDWPQDRRMAFMDGKASLWIVPPGHPAPADKPVIIAGPDGRITSAPWLS